MASGIVLLIVGGIFTFVLRSRLKRREVVTRETEERPDGTEDTEMTRVTERRVE